MALIHDATVTPSKLDLVQPWIETRSWATGSGPITKVAEYRFDDPAGEVGVETILWRTADGSVVQTPLTYRAAPLAGAEAHLVGTADHSVLGPRWVYDGCGDPVWAAALARAILTGGSQSNMYFVRDGERVDVPPRMEVRGSGVADADVPDIASVDSVSDDGAVTVVAAGPLELRVARVLGVALAGDGLLTGRIGDSADEHVLAALQSR